MFGFLKYRILFTTFDMEQCERVQNQLKKNDIIYKIKTVTNTHGKSGLGQLGENPKYSNSYQILVKDGDYEQAKFIANV